MNDIATLNARLGLLRARLLLAKYSGTQPRAPAGSSIGGRWIGRGGAGAGGGQGPSQPQRTPADGGAPKSVTPPPNIGGGATNPRYQQKAHTLHAMAQAGNLAGLEAEAGKLNAKVAESGVKLKTNSHDRWNAKLAVYANTLVGEVKGGGAPVAPPVSPPPPPPPPPAAKPPPPPPAVSPPPPPPPPTVSPGTMSSWAVKPQPPKTLAHDYPLKNITARPGHKGAIAVAKAKLDKLPPDHLGLLQGVKLTLGTVKGHNAAGLYYPTTNEVYLGKNYTKSSEVTYHEFGHALDRNLAITKIPTGGAAWAHGIGQKFRATHDPIYAAAVDGEHNTLKALAKTGHKEAKMLSHFTGSRSESFAQGYAALYASPNSSNARVQATRRHMPKTIEAVRDLLKRNGLTVPPITWTQASLAPPPPPPPMPVSFKPYSGYVKPA